jgi:ABC-type antimicrobial peptide transport system permease subunit
MATMDTRRLIRRSLVHYWRTNAAVVAGVATAVAVLAGALLVGDSVRGSLRALVEQRLGRTDLALVSSGFFREGLADDWAAREEFSGRFDDVAPLIVLPGAVTDQDTGRRVGAVSVYGVDDRFWRFHRVDGFRETGERDAVVNRALAEKIGLTAGSTILVRVQRPTDIPLESLQGQRDDLGRTIRLAVHGVAGADALGEFSLAQQQGALPAVFVPLARLQRDLEVARRANTLLVAARDDDREGLVPAIETLARRTARLEDVGLSVRTTTEGNAVIVESSTGLLDDGLATAIQRALTSSGLQTRAVFSYLANTLRHGDREIPYSLVSAIGTSVVAAAATPGASTRPSIVLNVWAARELQARAGDTIAMDYFVWEDPGRLVTHATELTVTSIVPIETGDRDLAPHYPGLSDAPSLSEWDPPFPIDLRKIRPVDEAYWERYRTTPKAFVGLDVGQRLWRSRHGAVSSIRIAADTNGLDATRGRVEQIVRAAVDPLSVGLTVSDVRAVGTASSRGATDFGEYFVYFSFFIVVSALVLAALFFRLGIEQRVREIGLLRAVGLGPNEVQRLFMAEGVLLAVAGSAIGVPGALGYAALLMAGLRTWWVDAVGTTALSLHVTRTSLLAGGVGCVAAATVCIWWTLRGLSVASERQLLAGDSDMGGWRSGLRDGHPYGGSRALGSAAAGLSLLGASLAAAGWRGGMNMAGAFFGAGGALLVASFCVFAVILRGQPRQPIHGRGWWAVARLGMRSATCRPGRSVLSMAVVASATFILVAVGAFRRDGLASTADQRSGTGGYDLIVESLLPIVHDPNSSDGREALNLFDLDASVTVEPFRFRPGDDASCLNLYTPRNPRILAPRPSFVAAGRFMFQETLAADPADSANPWRLLDRPLPDGAVPVIGDANSLAYVLHRAVGEDLVIAGSGGPITLRVVASLSDSIFQSELLMSEANFLRLFREQEGFGYLLVETGSAAREQAKATIGNALNDLGADVTGTAERLAAFHRVENTYLSTFQTLGGLGLLLGTVGLAAVLLRNVLERRRELALLAAVGFARRHLLLMAAAEHTVLVVWGIAAGMVCAAIAVVPAALERGAGLPIGSGALLLVFSVLVVTMISTLAAMAGSPVQLVEALRSE